MSRCKYKRVILFAVLTLLIIAFIWNNSLASREASGAQSGRITKLLQSILDPAGKILQESFHHFVRKAAHFTEFAALGLALCGLFRAIFRVNGSAHFAMPVLLALMVAVADEYIQLFADRGSAVADVVLDFAGAMFGLAVGVLILFLYQKRGVLWTFLKSPSKTTEN